MPEDSFWQSMNQQNIINTIKNDRFIHIDYNDLINKPEEKLKFLFNKIGKEINKIKLVWCQS